jgi:hypothetical protein
MGFLQTDNKFENLVRVSNLCTTTTRTLRSIENVFPYAQVFYLFFLSLSYYTGTQLKYPILIRCIPVQGLYMQSII